MVLVLDLRDSFVGQWCFSVFNCIISVDQHVTLREGEITLTVGGEAHEGNFTRRNLQQHVPPLITLRERERGSASSAETERNFNCIIGSGSCR